MAQPLEKESASYHVEDSKHDTEKLHVDEFTETVTWTKTQIGAVISLSALWVGKRILRILDDSKVS